MNIRSITFYLALLLTLVLSVNALSKEEEKIKKLNEMINENGYISLKEKSYELLIGSPRPYHTILLVTAANPQLKCEPCREIYPEFKALSKSWNNQDPGKLYFGILDYQNGKEIFKSLKIQNVPNVLYFKPSKTADGKPQFYDLQRKGLAAENMMNFITSKTDITFEIQKPINYSGYVFDIIIAMILIAIVVVMFKNFKQIFLNKKTWMIITLSVIFLMISGFMWVHIRHPPPNGGSKGRVEVFLPGFQQQYSTESQIMIVIYIIIAFSVLVLSEKISNIQKESQKKLAVYASMGTFIFFFSLLLRIFYIKSQAYPFRLL